MAPNIERWVSQDGWSEIEDWSLNGNCVVVVCRNHYTSEKLWRTKDDVAPYEVSISTNNEVYAYTEQRDDGRSRNSIFCSTIINAIGVGITTMFGSLLIQAADSSWMAQQSPVALELISSAGGTVIVYKNDRDLDYPVQAIKPYISEARLNKPLSKLLANGGSPLGVWDKEIALPRREAIERAIELDERVIYEREYDDWARWKFVELIIPTSSSVLVVVEDAQRWQGDAELWAAREAVLSRG